MALTAVILAGGLSRRMGGLDKGLIPLRGAPLILHVAARLSLQVAGVWINARHAEPWQGLGFPLALDRRSGAEGPLAGVEAALTACPTPWVVTAPCDTPFLPMDLVSRLVEAAGSTEQPAVVIRGDRLHATLALWPRSALGAVSAALDRGERRLAGWFAGHPHQRIPWEGGNLDPFFNVNTPTALAEAEAIWDAS